MKRNLVSRISFFLDPRVLTSQVFTWNHRALWEEFSQSSRLFPREHVCSVRARKGHRVAWGRDRAFAAIKNMGSKWSHAIHQCSLQKLIKQNPGTSLRSLYLKKGIGFYSIVFSKPITAVHYTIYNCLIRPGSFDTKLVQFSYINHELDNTIQ